MRSYSYDIKPLWPASLLLVFSLCSLGLFVVFGNASSIDVASTPFVYQILALLVPPTGVVSRIVAVLLVLLLAGLMFVLNRQTLLCKTETLLPLFFVILLLGLSSQAHFFSPALCACLLLLVALLFLFAANGNNAVWYIFDCMFFASISTWFVPSCMWYIPAFFIGLFVLRLVSPASLSAALWGIIMPYMLLAGGLFLTNRPDQIVAYVNKIPELICFQLQPMSWLHLAMGGLLLLLCLFSFIRNFSDIKLRQRSMLVVFMLMALTAFLLRLLYSSGAQHTPWLLLAFSPLLSRYFSVYTGKWSRCFFCLLIIILVSYFFFTTFG